VTIKLFGADATWHPAGIYPVKYAELLALRTDYGRFLVQRRQAGYLSDIQTYACRPIRGSTTSWSYHSWPRALDIRPAENPMRDDGVLETDFTRFGLLDGLRFVSAFLSAGFDWGATWDDTDPLSSDEKVRLVRRMLLRAGQKVRDGRVDAMHFELDDDSDAWSEARALRKLRAYRVRHPVYMQRVLASAGVKTCRQLLRAWRDGKA
jgi:hypothetical protein